MSYNVGSRSVHRRLLMDCNNGKLYNSQPVTIGSASNAQPLVSHFEFSLWQDTYISKLMLRKTNIPYTFYNTLSPSQGVNVSIHATFLASVNPADVYVGTAAMQPTFYQLTPTNFTQAVGVAISLLRNGVGAAPSTIPGQGLNFDPDDQQLVISYNTMGVSSVASGSHDLDTFSYVLQVQYTQGVGQMTIENMRLLTENMFSQVANSGYNFQETIGGGFVTHLVTVFLSTDFTPVQVGGVTTYYKSQIMNFVVPPYVLVHSDIMLHSLVKPAIITATQNMRQNEQTSTLTDGFFATVMGIAYLTQGGGMSSAVGRFYESIDDGNIENYLEMHSCTIKRFKVWFTYPDGTLIYWGNSRPILELYIID